MPELPEVEALRRGLLKYLIGSKIKDIKVLNEKLVSGKGTTRKKSELKTSEFINNLVGKKIVDIRRRAKNLIIELNTGEIILVHLKMTGQLVFQSKEKVGSEGRKRKPDREARRLVRPEETTFSELVLGGHPIQESELKLPHKHTYIIFTLSNGTLFYNDVRQFGYVLYFKNEKILDDEKHFEKIGLEPFDENFNLKYFTEKLKEKTTPIKKLLLDQSIVVGCGNIYCDEVLWASSVLPTRPGRSLKSYEIEKIYKNIKSILDKAINSGGSSVANYLLADGKRGNYTDYHQVYQRDGKPCQFPRCKGIIQKITFAGRGTHFCPVHQR